jgi:hypothetical protein
MSRFLGGAGWRKLPRPDLERARGGQLPRATRQVVNDDTLGTAAGTGRRRVAANLSRVQKYPRTDVSTNYLMKPGEKSLS